MNVTDEGVRRQRNFDTVRRVELLQQSIDIQRFQPGMPCAVLGDKRNTAASHRFPRSEALGCVEADLDPIAERVGNVKGFRD